PTHRFLLGLTWVNLTLSFLPSSVSFFVIFLPFFFSRGSHVASVLQNALDNSRAGGSEISANGKDLANGVSVVCVQSERQEGHLIGWRSWRKRSGRQVPREAQGGSVVMEMLRLSDSTIPTFTFQPPHRLLPFGKLP